MFKEFKEFAMKGNVVDLAVGLVMGAAFGAIVNSLVTDIITPIIGLITGGIDFSSRYVLLRDGNPPAPYVTLMAAKQAGAVTLNIGAFVSLTINFVIVSFALFLVVKAMNRMRRVQTAAPVPPVAPTREELLLTEIRDLLKGGRV
ncbi:MAG: large conductance mechanosensitive channel protein MscL [Acidobacteriaceae bacterium]|jgi:large conductance mechanosensitive channel|nr:large conductance mechanosensitive channel protein MscL [Acidobacteriaceae bacterium]